MHWSWRPNRFLIENYHRRPGVPAVPNQSCLIVGWTMKLPPPFENLKFDKVYEHYGVSLVYRGHEVTCYFHAHDEKTLSHLLPHACQFWKKRASFFKAFREYSAVELCQELNGTNNCGQDEFRPVTSAQIRRLLPAPCSVRFGFNDDLDDFCFETGGPS